METTSEEAAALEELIHAPMRSMAELERGVRHATPAVSALAGKAETMIVDVQPVQTGRACLRLLHD
jgi:hypothetical protein